jgi:hypothetical protein
MFAGKSLTTIYTLAAGELVHKQAYWKYRVNVNQVNIADRVRNFSVPVYFSGCPHTNT